MSLQKRSRMGCSLAGQNLYVFILFLFISFLFFSGGGGEWGRGACQGNRGLD